MVFVQGALAAASKVGPNLFPLGRIVKVVHSGYKVTNSTNPLTIGANVILTVLECSAPPPLRLAVACVTFAAALTSALTGPNPVSCGATVHFMGEIYDQC
jgi:hypothetical protein